MRRLFALLSVAWLLALGPAAADSVVQNENTRAELVAEAASIAPDQTVWLAFTLTPREGWHTYWRNPGDSGATNILEWRLPAGFSAGEIAWPAPELIAVGPLMNYGYKGPATLLIPITAPAGLAGETVEIGLSAEWLVCDVICVPEMGDFALTLRVGGGAADPAHRQLFADARARLPQPLPFAVTAHLDNQSVIFDLPMGAFAANQVREAYFYPAEEGFIAYAAAQSLTDSADGTRLTAARAKMAMPVSHAVGVLSLTPRDGPRQAFEVDVPLVAAVVADDMPVLQAVLFALLGGLLLNLMPCVFPVLSLKALALVRLSEHTPGAARADGLAYTAGVVSSFLVVAAALIAVKGAGEAVGWGFQLQSPVFVLAMALILFAVGLSFTGLFSLGTVFAGLGQGLAERKGPAGSFFTGVLATLVATPCTAPFMAPALGFALTQPALLGLVIFAALGFGLALPYLLISFLPPVARLLPKPGAWMETFQQFLAFPMFLTVIWLVWVLGRQTGATVSALALVGMVALAFAIWAWRRVGGLTGRGLAIAASGAWLILAAQFLASMTPDPASSQAEIAYEAYSEARVAELRAAETPIFVNFTADWCITCLVNERVALSTPEVVEFFRSRNIHALKADWTNRSPEIAGKLAEFGRSGIPLYLFYAPLSPEPLILPQVLTPGMVVEKIDESLTIKLAEERGGS